MQQRPRRLIEVDLPIARISAHARREKSIRHGHISTLHIWWARRPLAACRAVLCATLWPDPADPACPDSFREQAKQCMQKWAREHLQKLGKESFSRFIAIQKDPALLDDPEQLRAALLDFIADFANWDNSADEDFLRTARMLTQAAHETLGGIPGTRPLVVDPFAGGGAIPLEALRVGADAFASDLNPVAVLLNKVVLEYIPKYGKRLADEVRRWGMWIKEQAEQELGEFYPQDENGAVPIAYIWARTIRCEGPGCGAEVPLMRSLWLAKKAKRKVALRFVPRPQEKRVDFEILENPKAEEVPEGTVRRGAAVCPCCGYTTPVARVRAQLKARRGGARDARLVAVVTTRPGEQGRRYRLPTERDLEAVRRAAEELARRERAHDGVWSLVPDEPLPPPGTLGFRVQRYGMETWGNLFNPRQALALVTLVRLTREVGARLRRMHDADFASAVQSCLALIVDRQATYLSTLTAWVNSGEFIANLFGRQALPIVWDWAECNPWVEGSGNWEGSIEWVELVIRALTSCQLESGQVQRFSATRPPLPDDTAQCFFTDPPYYDAVPYADLSDFFFVWLKRTLGDVHPDLFGAKLAPKDEECIVDETKGKDRAFFERAMAEAMAEGRRVLAPDGIGVVVFAHKTTAGWEALLQAMVDAGWIITASWPIDTERPGRLRSQGSAALASSVHLVCRPRENPDGTLVQDAVGDWRAVLAELPRRIHEWMPRLAREGIVGADAIFACLGPALEIFSRWARVEKASGEVVTLREYLEHVWAAIAREALGMVFAGADASGFEDDARLTAMWLWTLGAGGNGAETDEDDEARASSRYVLEYDAVRKIAQGLGVELDSLGHLVEIRGEKARLLPVAERARYLFGGEASARPARRRRKARQGVLFAELEEAEASGWGSLGAPRPGRTVLDRLHQSMILFASGRGEALRRFLVDEGAGRDAQFWKLAQALSALYPANSEEKRWVDGVLARKKGLGL